MAQPANRTDDETVADEVRALRSRPGGMAEVFARYRDRLLRMVMLRLDGRIAAKVDAEDVLQDVFLESARRVQDFLDRPSVPLFVWLRQITQQVLADTHRRYLGAQMRDVRREMTLPDSALTDAGSANLLAHLADSLTSPSQFALRREACMELQAALARLGERDREVLVLRHLEELTNDEVAQVLGIDKYAASKRYLRALERLRVTLSGHL